MRLSLILSGVLAVGAAIAVSACSGSNTVPSQSGTVANAVVDATQPHPDATPDCYTSKYQPTWIMKGACTIGTLTNKGGTVKLATYKGIGLTAVVPPNNAPKPFTFVLVDALDKSDILPYKGHPFIAYNGNKGVFIYAQGVQLSKSPIMLKKNLSLTFTYTGKAPGTTCTLGYLNQKDSWTLSNLSVKPAGGKIFFNVPDSLVNEAGGFPPYPKSLFLVIYCKS